ncbi:ketopantoate reductase family protein [Kocuria rosea]|uniref:ketopantoate reductase family protein n=1 Tax=Kocuria rosea TaxID=1275 RepID=UPI002B251463|nr:ketopantoate reductase family protein [Kocuria rosea]MEB2619880.1 ketopantoate reductase family protein [Kocuria rosea]
MRILIAGAGATGGYFGARLAQAGRDVTFLVRSRRAEQLEGGLRLVGPGGEEIVPVATVTAQDLQGPYDLVIVAVKAGALPDVIDQTTPAVGEDTMVLPFLNGMAHLTALNDRFGTDRVLGGIVKVVATVAADGAIHQMHSIATLALGPQAGPVTDRVRRIYRELSAPGIQASIAEDAVGAMWHKWAFITAAGVITGLMRAPIGDIVAAPDGERFIRAVIAETEQVAAAAGHPTPGPEHDAMVGMLSAPGSGFTSSLYRDVTAGLPHEGEHLLGAFVATAAGLGVDIPLTALALLQLRAHDHATA